jgi:hypothetical protein
MLAFPRLMFSRSITSSVLSGCAVMYSSACSSAMVRLIPHVCPISPQRRMNRSWAVINCSSTEAA